MSTGQDSMSARVVSRFSSPARQACRTIPTGVVAAREASRMSRASSRCRTRPLLRGLYRAMTKSPAAARARRRSIASHGVRRSDREMTAKSCISGAPSTDAAACRAETPGTTTISGVASRPSRSPASSITNPAMPYIPASPLETRATVLPDDAASSALRHRSTSRVIPEETTSFPASSGSINSRYVWYPTTTLARSIASRASKVI